jgi:arabinofuranosyltransferase
MGESVGGEQTAHSMRLRQFVAALTARLRRRPAAALLTSAVVAAGTLAVYLHQRSYGPFFTDDGFISLRYTERLLEGKGLTWDDHERVEGYSNLSWVLLCAVPGLFGVKLVSGARAVGMLCTAGLLGAVVAALKPARPLQWLGAGLVMGLYAASDSIAVWSMGGLEGPLLGALLAWGIVAALAAVRTGVRTSTFAAAACFGLICWTRPDGALWSVAAVIGLGIGFRKQALRTALAIGVGALVFVAVQLVFRLVYYHEYVPNTAYAKVALTDDRLSAGVEHLTNSLLPLAGSWLALVTCGLHGLRHERLRGVTLLHLVLALVWTGYMVRIGGDIFPAWRLLGYVVVVAGSLVAFILRDDLRSPTAPAALRWVTALVALTAVGSHYDPFNWAERETWQWDGQAVGTMLGRLFKQARPLIAVDAAGAIPYYSKFPALDMLGLTDRYLAHHRPRNIGSGFMGHELGDVSYYLERAPDLICIGVPPCQHAGKFPAQRELVARRDFQRDYAPLHFEASKGRRTVTAALWVRRKGRVGIHSTPTSLEVPSYFLTAPEGAATRLTDAGTAEASLPAAALARVERLSLGPGRWRFEALSPRGSARIALLSASNVLAAGDALTPLEFTLPNATTVDVQVTAAAGSSFTTEGLVFRHAR